MHCDIIEVLSAYLSYNTGWKLVAIYSWSRPPFTARLHGDRTIRYSNRITIRDFEDSYYIVTPQTARYTIYKDGIRTYLYCRDNMSIFRRNNKVYIQISSRGINFRNGHKYELEYIFAVIFDLWDVIILSCEYDTIYPFREDSYCYIHHTQLDIAEIIKSRYYQCNTELSRYTNIICA